MATFTQLDGDDARAIADAADLGAVHAVTPIAAGTINSNFAFDCARGRFFVRVNEGKTAADVAWEADLVTALADGGVPTPPPRPIGATGQRWLAHRGLLVSVFPWVAGGPRAAADVTAADAAVVGHTLARIHQRGSARGAATWRAGIYRFADLVERFRGFAGSTDPALAAAIAVLGPELAAQADAAALRARATRGLVHGDLFRDNVLWDGDALTAVLDFEQAAAGSLVYDVAVAIHDWCWATTKDDDARADASPAQDVARDAGATKHRDDAHPVEAPAEGTHGRFRPALAAALVAAHRAAQPWSDADRAALPIELRAAAARFTITRITDVHLRQVDNPDKDFRAFLARLAFWRSPAAAAAAAALASL